MSLRRFDLPTHGKTESRNRRMNKKDLSERDICSKFVGPAIKRAGWDGMMQIREEVPLPPLAEQRRIVAKVNALMSFCDQLETKLAATQSEGGRLLEAVLHSALATAGTACAGLDGAGMYIATAPLRAALAG